MDLQGILAALQGGGNQVPARDRQEPVTAMEPDLQQFAQAAGREMRGPQGGVPDFNQFKPQLRSMSQYKPVKRDVPPVQKEPVATVETLPADDDWSGMFERLLKREGGYNANDADRGAVNMGMTQKTYEELTGKKVTKDFIKRLSRSDVEGLYKKHFYKDKGFDQVQDPKLREMLFDYGVMSGPGAAVRTLQETLNSMGANIEVDGGMGPETLNAIRVAEQAFGDELSHRYLAERSAHYARLVSENPQKYKKNVRGWRNRLETLRG